MLRTRVAQATLAQVLLAHKAVLGRHGMLAAEDTRYYRLVVALSLRPEPGWWDKLRMQHASGGPSSQLGAPRHSVALHASGSTAHGGPCGSCGRS